MGGRGAGGTRGRQVCCLLDRNPITVKYDLYSIIFWYRTTTRGPVPAVFLGENAGGKQNRDGGIAIYVAAEQPAGVLPENWLPIERTDMGLTLIMRVYVPDLERMRTWPPPKAARVGG